MKRLILLTLTLFIFPESYGQDWVKKMQDPNVNFYEVQKSFNDYYLYREKRGGGYKQFKRWEHFMKRRTYPSGDRIPSASRWRESQQYAATHRTSAVASNWTELGPRTAIDITGHWAPGLGRINCIAIHPQNQDIIYIGSPSGGIWKTTSGGLGANAWQPLTDDLPVLGVSSIIIDPQSPNTLYIATGDGNATDTYSIGVLKSTDGGLTWNTTGLTYDVTDFKRIDKLLMHPSDPNIILAASSSGVIKTTDGFATWSVVQTGDFDDIEFKPNDPNTVYATTGAFWKSTDGGDSFTKITNGIPTVNWSQIAVTPAQPDYVYALNTRSDNNLFGGIYRSTDSGSSFTKRNTSDTNIFGYIEGDNYSQAYYDLAFAISPTNADELQIGAIETYRSLDGGQTITNTSSWIITDNFNYIHPDVHALEYVGNTLFVGNDGRIVKSTDQANSFINISEGLGIRQFYGIGLSKTNPNKICGGSQDNGTSVYTNGRWHEWLGADGGDCHINWRDENIIYGIIQLGQSWHKSVNGGDLGGDVSITNPGGGAWIVPYEMSESDPDMIVAGLAEVRITKDGMKTWNTISSFGLGALDELALAPSSPNYIYVSKNNRIFVTKDQGANWSEISAGLPNLFISYITVHPSDPEKIAISFSGYTANQKVYTSTDAGQTWTNVSGTLPNIPANCVVYHDIAEDGLYVGMDVGVYYRDNTLSDWNPFNTGMPNAIVNELHIHYGTNKLRAATYGRGLWESDVAVNKNLLADFSSNKLSLFPREGVSFTDESIDLVGSVSNWNWSFPGGFPPMYQGKNPPEIVYNAEGFYDVSLTVTNNSGEQSTKVKSDYIRISEEYNANQQEITTCSGKFYESGMLGNYQNNETTITTIRPGEQGRRIKMEFVTFKLEYEENCQYDYLEIYDGENVNSPLIGRFCSYNSPGTVLATNPSGALTFRFVSDDMYPTAGWEANVMCVPVE
ncbi:MAG: VPS10 domain-containing protein [Flammeovirgaceae bacterium]